MKTWCSHGNTGVVFEEASLAVTVTIIVNCRELSQPDLYETDSEQGGRCSQTYTVVVTRKAC